MYPRAANPGEVQMEAFSKRSVDLMRHELGPRVHRAHLGKRAVPIILEVVRAWIAALVAPQLRERVVEDRHRERIPAEYLYDSPRERRVPASMGIRCSA